MKDIRHILEEILMKLYVLKGDIEQYDYAIYGCYTSRKEMLLGAEEVIGWDFAIAEWSTEQYGFSGLVYSEIDDSKLNKTDGNGLVKHEIYWNKDEVEAYL